MTTCNWCSELKFVVCRQNRGHKLLRNHCVITTHIVCVHHLKHDFSIALATLAICLGIETKQWPNLVCLVVVVESSSEQATTTGPNWTHKHTQILYVFACKPCCRRYVLAHLQFYPIGLGQAACHEKRVCLQNLVQANLQENLQAIYKYLAGRQVRANITLS